MWDLGKESKNLGKLVRILNKVLKGDNIFLTGEEGKKKCRLPNLLGTMLRRTKQNQSENVIFKGRGGGRRVH